MKNDELSTIDGEALAAAQGGWGWGEKCVWRGIWSRHCYATVKRRFWGPTPTPYDVPLRGKLGDWF